MFSVSLGILSFLVASSSFASLGQGLSSIQANAKEIHAKLHKSSSRNFQGAQSPRLSESNEVQTYSLTSEMNEVQQHLDPQGIVFAITWQGLNHPDLSRLLGSYFKDYSVADAEVKGSRGQSLKRIATSQLVVEKGGHMGAVHGIAYLVNSVPPGVEIDQLK